jgi:Family of unknown function (DUF5947)
MNAAMYRSSARGLASLRRFASKQPAVERCELCAAVVSSEHQHLVDPEHRRLLCVCQACAILFDEAGRTGYRRVPRDIRQLADFEIPGEVWAGLAIPIGLAFLFRSSTSAAIVAIYPSPAGPTEAVVDEEDWKEVEALHSSLAGLRPDVEALLVNRTKGSRDYYIAPIDECYKLAALIRRLWRGFSGGDEVWDAVRSFFEGFERRSLPERMPSRA